MFAENMPITIMSDTVIQRYVKLLMNTGLQKFVSHINYRHVQTRATLKIEDTQG